MLQTEIWCLVSELVCIRKFAMSISILLFQNWDLGIALTNDKWHSAIPLFRSCQCECVCNFLSKYSKRFKRCDQFPFFRIWTSAKPRPTTNGIWQSFGLDRVNINVYANFYHNISNGSRVMGNFRKLISDGHTTLQTDRARTMRL